MPTTTDRSAEPLLSVVRQGLAGIGYTDRLIRENYGFVNVATPDWPLHRIRLVAFAEDPPSYRNACFGVAIPSEGDLRRYTGLGVPQLLTLHPEEDRIVRWMVRATADPERIESLSPADFRSRLEERRDDWSPGQILRAKAVRSPSPRQLDFYDTGLMPALEDAVQRKLDELLKDVILRSQEAYLSRHDTEPDYVKLYRLTFRLVAAKLLGDREYPGDWLAEDVTVVLKAIQGHYYSRSEPETILDDRYVQQIAWDRVRTGVLLQNVSVDALAYIYENTLVDRTIRSKQDIHATPSELTDYIVNNLPFEDLSPEGRTVLEPFAGHAPFLTAALRRLRALMSPDITPEDRHDYFVRMLCGIERNEFAREVSRYSLMLGDYPNPNSWQLLSGDVFKGSALDSRLKKSAIVLSNPPFGDFTTEERELVHPDRPNKAAELVRRILEYPPFMLGLVLPRSFTSGSGYRQLRAKLSETYRVTNLVVLPDVFRFSEAPTVLVMAHRLGAGPQIRRSGFVSQADYQQFRLNGSLTWDDHGHRPAYLKAADLWTPPLLGKLTEAVQGLPTLSSVADVHRGIEYKSNVAAFVFDSTKQTEGLFPGLHKVTDDFEPYVISHHVKLRITGKDMRGNAHKLPWDKPKVIANAARRSRESWKITAVPDRSGMVCYQNFHGIWPTDISRMPLEVLAAILNGPLANAFIGEQVASRGNQVRLVDAVPLPNLGPVEVEGIKDLVSEYIEERNHWIANPSMGGKLESYFRECLLRIDAMVLAGYDLTPRLEKEVLDYFAGTPRPGPVHFDGYYPKGFAPAIPLHVLVSKSFDRASASRTLERLSPLDDDVITEMLKEIM